MLPVSAPSISIKAEQTININKSYGTFRIIYSIYGYGQDCQRLMSTQQMFHYIEINSFCCICQRLTIENMGVIMTARKSGVPTSRGKLTQVCSVAQGPLIIQSTRPSPSPFPYIGKGIRQN